MKTKQFRLFKSKSALALPVTYLILFVSTMLLISVTYVFAVDQVNSQKQSFQVLTAQQDMTSLDNDVLSVMSQPGASATLDFRDSGGQLSVEPLSNYLTLTLSDNEGLSKTIFSESTGQVVYDLPSAVGANVGFYIEGDSNTITNETGSSISQLYTSTGSQGPQLLLGYRPEVTYASAGTENGQAATDIRIYIVNLNSSEAFALNGELPLQISCVNTQLTTLTYQVSYPLENLLITSELNGFNGSVSLPISSNSEGATVNVQIVSSNVLITEGNA